MLNNHNIFEIRTGRDSENTPEVFAQVLATLPKLKNNAIQKLLKKDERLSFEILVQNQTIYFLYVCPARLSEYLKSIISASYPEVMINQLQHDPLWHFSNNDLEKDTEDAGIKPANLALVTKNLNFGYLTLKNQDYFPLKTYLDFKDIDPLATLLSALSKSEADDQILVQFLVKDDRESWKNAGFSKLGNGASASFLDSAVNSVTGAEGNLAAPATGSTPQKSLIEKKLAQKSLLTQVKIVTCASTKERSRLILDSLGTTFNVLSLSESNSLDLKIKYVFKNQFFARMKERRFGFAKNNHFSLDELATLYHLPNHKLAQIPNLAWGKNLLGEPPENLPIVTKDSPEEVKKNINVFAKTTYKNQEVKYGAKRADRRRHLYVIGKTGTGKSTMLANMAINDLKNNEGLCVIDPHGDLVETLLDYIPSHRINDVIYFDPSDMERTVQINLFEGENIAHRELIASGIISIFHKLYGYSWGPRLEYILRNALLTLLTTENARLSDILQLLTNEKFRAEIVDKLEDPILKSFWVDEFNAMQDRQRTESIASVLNKVGQFVTSPLVRNVVNAHKSSFSIEEIMDQGKILLVNLSQGKLGEDNATLLGAMFITKIQLAAMARVNIEEEKRRDFYLYVDEFQNFATDSFNKILSEARKYRLNLILANQYVAQIPDEVQKAIFGNCGNIVSFVMGADDASLFTKEYGSKYTQEDLVSLGRHQIINKVSIDNVLSQPFPAFTLPLASSSNQNREKVVKVSRERYAKKKG